ncbi:IspD/TarI family cytidylyltransferase [Gracilinema caldarium]|uniref:4-diphosphocytidyl-2C-methyl-D-erythritolsynthase n=1 Tax=Gracilinema caldarium (strain ATCC 51460 / DSM 7334 / H1) TaxID=744872 RepID=F8F0U6_GRAC1|nr:IspD/TarI family cytidylyltransferase [Gracilinema caldarium]AEJ20232.1 4-diphosphocytidyl-2C-methyl-D-erythritolsynthase [Gracilinema caldarium DSM 7334]
MEGRTIAAVITAAGASSRMGGIKKEYHLLGDGRLDGAGKPLTVLGSAVLAFAACSDISYIVITVPSNPETGEMKARQALPVFPGTLSPKQKIIFVPGSNTRRSSVHHALELLKAYHVDYVLIHDGARPWVQTPLIQRTIQEVILHKAVIPVMPLVETPKEINAEGIITRHLRRANIVSAQTPQAFYFPEILSAHELAEHEELEKGKEFTDDAEVWGQFIGPVYTILGDPGNKKITFPEDLP